MKKNMYVISATLVLLLTVSSCNGLDMTDVNDTPLMVPITSPAAESEESPETVDLEVTEADTSDEPESQPDVTGEPETFTGRFKQGTWFSYNKDECRYYFFDDRRDNNTRLSVKSASGSAFLYEISDGADDTHKKAVFHIDTTDNNTKAEITINDPSHITIIWEDKSEEKLIYISPDGMQNFMFYTDDELCSMGLNYYTRDMKKRDGKIAAEVHSNEDGSASVKIYKNSNDGKQIIYAWYIVDRLTAEGEKSDDGIIKNGTPVDLR